MTAKRDVISLKWGTLKAWNVHSESALSALQLLADAGPRAMSVATQEDTPEQRLALLNLIDAVGASGGDIWLDWDGRIVTAEEARNYITTYGWNQ